VISGLKHAVGLRCRARAEALLAGRGLFADWRVERLAAASPGVALELIAEFGVLSAGFAALGVRGKPAEQLAEDAVSALGRFMRSRAAVDERLADQLIVPLAVAAGASCFTTSRVTRHLVTVAELARLFLPGVEVSIEGEPDEAGTVRIRT
jgi:RNA 3'-terminal phosphate cyclase (ATP)